MVHRGQDDAYIRYCGVPALCNAATVDGIDGIRGTGFGNPRRAHLDGSRRVRRGENHWKAEKYNELDPALV